MEDILKKDGLSLELLGDLSYQSGLGIRLKRNLHYFNREIQYNTFYDRQLNNWLHKYVYKRNCENHVGSLLRQA